MKFDTIFVDFPGNPIRGNFFDNKNILVIAPHPDDEIIGCGAMLLSLAGLAARIDIAYAVTGFNGVSDTFASLQGVYPSIQQKTHIRQNEARAVCAHLHVNPHFLQLPFYEMRQTSYTHDDVDCVKQLVDRCVPDIIFLIDESHDPHGTHGMVRSICRDAFESTAFGGSVWGYKIWQEGYARDEISLSVAFNQDIMSQKETLLDYYSSQMLDPAYPHELLSFAQIMKQANEKTAHIVQSKYQFVEGYRRLIIQS